MLQRWYISVRFGEVSLSGLVFASSRNQTVEQRLAVYSRHTLQTRKGMDLYGKQKSPKLEKLSFFVKLSFSAEIPGFTEKLSFPNRKQHFFLTKSWFFSFGDICID